MSICLLWAKQTANKAVDTDKPEERCQGPAFQCADTMQLPDNRKRIENKCDFSR